MRYRLRILILKFVRHGLRGLEEGQMAKLLELTDLIRIISIPPKPLSKCSVFTTNEG